MVKSIITRYGNPSNDGQFDTSGLRSPTGVTWTRRINSVDPILIKDDICMVACPPSCVLALDTKDGSIKWSFPENGFKGSIKKLIGIVDDRLFVTSDEGICVISALTGEPILYVRLTDIEFATNDQDRIYVCGNSHIFAFDSNRGNKLWANETYCPKIVDIACSDDHIHLLCSEGSLSNFAKEDGRRIWEEEIGVDIDSERRHLAVIGERLYCLARDGKSCNLQLYSAKNGQRLTSELLNIEKWGRWKCVPWQGLDSILALNHDGCLYNIDYSDLVLWRYPVDVVGANIYNAQIAGTAVYVSQWVPEASDFAIACVDLHSGSLIWRKSTSDPVTKFYPGNESIIYRPTLGDLTCMK